MRHKRQSFKQNIFIYLNIG